MKPPSVSIDPVTDERFELVRSLGEGASGAVYLALDRETGEHVALKKLFKLDSKSVQRFKREFRSLADIHHPNLVKLYDLHRGLEAWFITMEYVAGNDFRQFCAEAMLSHDSVQPANDNAPAKLLAVFYDLACGVHAIHRAGMLHRDLKPSNALVAHDGRVVVLDFGLVREIDGSRVTQDGTVAGTPAYMPPEQAAGEKLSEASDWYAFGAMLYEAISGVLPIDGRNAMALIQRKLTDDPHPLHSGAPTDVLDLCMALLSREPGKRPSGDKVLDVLAAASGGKRAETTTAHEHLTIFPSATSSAQVLFGRAHELEQLRAASLSSQDSNSFVVHVRGASGSGKSTLVEHFLEEAASSDLMPAVVLRSRCYEREAMPFKALDGVLEALVTHLSRLDVVSCAHLLPTEITDLSRLFPVLERLPAVQQLRSVSKARGDETQVRWRAEQGLRMLVTRVAGTQRLILWIDDMQWGDLDSAGVLRDWLDQPLPVPVCIVLSYRSEEMHTSPALMLLLNDQRESSGRDAHTVIDIDPLRPSDVRTLCLHRLTQISMPPEAMIDRIVSESHGNPFLAQQLTAIAEAKLARHDTSLDGLSMGALVQSASLYLGDSARSLLQVLAIAGRPVSPQLALRAARVSNSGRAHIHALRGLRLIRTRDVGSERLLEVYHDRVREAVQASLSAEEAERVHRALLQELETLRPDDHDWLHTLALGAGQRARAFRHGLLAAERATESLASERAAELYRTCLVLVDGEMELYLLWMKLATAEAHCRRGHEAAKAYSSAAEHAPAAERGELMQLAAAHLVRSGRFAEGERMVQQVLATEKMHVPKTNAGLFAALGWEYGRLALRSLNVPLREGKLRQAQRAKTAILYGTLSAETQLYAPLRAALFSARALRMALDYGSPTHVARVLSLAAAIACQSGTRRAARRSQELLDRAEQLFRRSGDPEVQLELLCVRAVCAQFTGDIWAALEPAKALERMLETRNATALHGDYFYLFSVRVVQISSLQALGRLLEARQVLHEHVAHARATDNLAAVFQVTMNRVVDEQAFNMCADSRARLDAEYPQLPKGGFGILNMVHLLGVMRAACATRDFEWAFERLAEFWQPYNDSVVHRSAFVAMLAHTVHSRLLINHHIETGASGDIEALVRDDMKQLARLPPGLLAEIPVARLRSRLAALKGDRETAIRLLRGCVARMADSGVKQELEHDRYTLGLLIGGSEGGDLVASARTGLTECGISDPDANMRAYVPELMR